MVASVLLVQCDSADERSGKNGSASRARPALIGSVRAEEITARTKPKIDSEPIATFPKVNAQGAPQVFLLEPKGGRIRKNDRWVKALLPIRPNGTTGYLPVDELDVSSTLYRIEVDRKRFRLALFKGETRMMDVPIALGTGETPTPVGRFFLASLLRPPDPNTVYGPYAYGLSGYSDTLTDWEDGGIIGLHGTNDPSSIGRAVSHGCIRMRNKDIEKLVPLLPLGTPIQIT